MLYEVIQSDWFWPTVGVSLAGYYVWVVLTYFKPSLTGGFRGIGSASVFKKTKLQLNWDELAMAFELHRRLIANPLAHLDQQERALLETTPFKELIRQTTIN